MDQLHPVDLVKIILEQPTVTLVSTGEHNTGYAASYELNPGDDLLFMRDQMITTAKGVVLGSMNSEQRRVETRIAKFALHKLGVEPIYEVTGDGRLEGGDFIPAGTRSSWGKVCEPTRTPWPSSSGMMCSGGARVVVVKEQWHSQDQMHLDTYFNVLGPDLAVLVEERMDLSRRGGPVVKAARLIAGERDVYELDEAGYELVRSATRIFRPTSRRSLDSAWIP